jgi:crotonobetainyl-CoA:carnitine CoA-transferase CaiB-like acyl-CoA transferase
VLDVAQALDNPFVAERHGIATFHGSPHGGDIRMVTSPIRVPGEEIPQRAAPGLGADTDDILGRLGFGADEIAALRARGVI